MYAVETAKMSSKGQLVVPDASAVEASVAESANATSPVKARMKRASRSLDKLASLGISLPIDIESGERRMGLLRNRHA